MKMLIPEARSVCLSEGPSCRAAGSSVASSGAPLAWAFFAGTFLLRFYPGSSLQLRLCDPPSQPLLSPAFSFACNIMWPPKLVIVNVCVCVIGSWHLTLCKTESLSVFSVGMPGRGLLFVPDHSYCCFRLGPHTLTLGFF